MDGRIDMEFDMDMLDKDNLARKDLKVLFWKSEEDGFIEVPLKIRRIGPLELQSVISEQEIKTFQNAIEMSEKESFTRQELSELFASTRKSDILKEIELVSRIMEKACVSHPMSREQWMKFMDRMPNVHDILKFVSEITDFTIVTKDQVQKIKN